MEDDWKETTIVSAFPATGKSYFYANCKDLIVLDSDSSKFSWLSEGVRNPNFLRDYIKHIRDNVTYVDMIFVSSHDDVRDIMFQVNTRFTLVYPERELKNEYLKRYKERGSPKEFIEMMNRMWDSFIDSMEREDGCSHKVILKSGEYISDRIEEIKFEEK